ncbi:MAG TPA: hypothetical protein VH591_19775 [Ktedonobacterales bacterium]
MTGAIPRRRDATALSHSKERFIREIVQGVFAALELAASPC